MSLFGTKDSNPADHAEGAAAQRKAADSLADVAAEKHKASTVDLNVDTFAATAAKAAREWPRRTTD